MSDSARVVLDCNVLLQALSVPEGPAGRCVQMALKGRVTLCMSPTVLAELRNVTARPKVVKKLHLMSERVEEFFDAIDNAAIVFDGFPEPFAYERDPDDAHYVNLAMAANASLIVSRDRDLLDLMASSDVEAVEFRLRFPKLRIVNPVAFLAGQSSVLTD